MAEVPLLYDNLNESFLKNFSQAFKCWWALTLSATVENVFSEQSYKV